MLGSSQDRHRYLTPATFPRYPSRDTFPEISAMSRTVVRILAILGIIAMIAVSILPALSAMR